MKHIELTQPIDEMDDEDLRATFADVMTAHAANVEEFEALETKFSEAEARAESAESDRDEAATYFAAQAAQSVNLPAETILDKFEFSEIRELAEQDADGEPSVPSEDPEADVEADEASEDPKFTDKPERAEVGGQDGALRAQARSDLATMFGGYDD
jgi:hypothetical protein